MLHTRFFVLDNIDLNFFSIIRRCPIKSYSSIYNVRYFNEYKVLFIHLSHIILSYLHFAINYCLALYCDFKYISCFYDYMFLFIHIFIELFSEIFENSVRTLPFRLYFLLYHSRNTCREISITYYRLTISFSFLSNIL